MILRRRNIDFDKKLKYLFGSYMIVLHENKPFKNDPWPRCLDYIYLRAKGSLKGGHEVFGLSTGRVSTIPCVTLVKIIEMVIK